MEGAGERIAVSRANGGSSGEMALVRAALAGDRPALEQLLGPHRRCVVAIWHAVSKAPTARTSSC